ncbi:MAG: winged helix-turn-helix transcriptional regulator [Clostridia bacterium]|nr:winged helix-turn-helix transcriptional regulator [Clostridia bacterium]
MNAATEPLYVDDINAEYVCQLFKQLGDPNRLRIVCALLERPQCVADLAAEVGMEQSALSHQLKNLKNASLVRCERQGRQIVYSLDDSHVLAILVQALDHAEHVRKGE